MSKTKKTKREQAFDLYKKHAGKINLIEIANILDSPTGTIRGWKSKDKWDDKIAGTFRNAPAKMAERTTKSNQGAPLGNQNATGNKGNSNAAPPLNNKNALKTGEYETLFLLDMSIEEQTLFQLEVESFLVMQKEVRLLEVRQSRMLKRIKEIEGGLSDKETERLSEIRGTQLKETKLKERHFRKIDDILRIEEALTRVSKQIERSVKRLEEARLARADQSGSELALWKDMLAEVEKEMSEADEP